jgi:hypothetical protein
MQSISARQFLILQKKGLIQARLNDSRTGRRDGKLENEAGRDVVQAALTWLVSDERPVFPQAGLSGFRAPSSSKVE